MEVRMISLKGHAIIALLLGCTSGASALFRSVGKRLNEGFPGIEWTLHLTESRRQSQ